MQRLTENLKPKVAEGAETCVNTGTTEACKEAIIEQTPDGFKAGVKASATAFKKEAKIEFFDGASANGKAEFGKAEAEGSFKWGNDPHIKIGAGIWLAKATGGAKLVLGCADDHCYELDFSVSAGLGAAAGVNVGSKKTNSGATYEAGFGIGPIKPNIRLMVTNKNPSTTEKSKTIEIPLDNNELQELFLPSQKNEFNPKISKKLFKYINPEYQNDLNKYAKDYAFRLRQQLPPIKITLAALQKKWLEDKGSINKDILSTFDLKENSFEADYLLGLIQEEFLYSLEPIQHAISATNPSQAKEALHNIKQEAKIKIHQYENKKGELYQEEQAVKVELAKHGHFISQEGLGRARAELFYKKAADIFETVGLFAGFSGNERLAQDMVVSAQVLSMVPAALTATAESVTLLGGMLSGSVAFSAGTAVTAFTGFAPILMVGGIIMQALMTGDDQSQEMLNAIYHWLNPILHKHGIMLDTIMSDVKDLKQGMIELFTQMQNLEFTEEQILQLVQDFYSEMRQKMFVQQKMLSMQAHLLTEDNNDIRNILKEFKFAEITKFYDKTKRAMHRDLEYFILHTFDDLLVDAITAAKSNVLTLANKEVNSQNIEHISGHLAPIRKYVPYNDFVAGFNAINLLQEVVTQPHFDVKPILSNWATVSFKHPLGLYLIAETLDEMIGKLLQQGKNIKKLLPLIEEDIEWINKESTKLSDFVLTVNIKPEILNELFIKARLALIEMRNRISEEIHAFEIEKQKQVKRILDVLVYDEKMRLENELKTELEHTKPISKKSCHGSITERTGCDFGNELIDTFTRINNELIQQQYNYIGEFHKNNTLWWNQQQTKDTASQLSLELDGFKAVLPKRPMLKFISNNNSSDVGYVFRIPAWINWQDEFADELLAELLGVGYMMATYSRAQPFAFDIKFYLLNNNSSRVIKSFQKNLDKDIEKEVCIHILVEGAPCDKKGWRGSYDNLMRMTYYWNGGSYQITKAGAGTPAAKVYKTVSPQGDLSHLPEGSSFNKSENYSSHKELLTQSIDLKLKEYRQELNTILRENPNIFTAVTRFEYTIKILYHYLMLLAPNELVAKEIHNKFFNVVSACDRQGILDFMSNYDRNLNERYLVGIVNQCLHDLDRIMIDVMGKNNLTGNELLVNLIRRSNHLKENLNQQESIVPNIEEDEIIDLDNPKVYSERKFNANNNGGFDSDFRAQESVAVENQGSVALVKKSELKGVCYTVPIKVDSETGEPIYYCVAKRNDEMVGSAEFYGRPYPCISEDKSRNNILTTEREFPTPKTDAICPVVLPPTLFDKVKESAIKGGAHGLLRGSTNVLSDNLESKGVSKLKAKTAGQIVYYGSLFTVSVISRSSKITDPESCLNALYESVVETGHVLLINTVLAGASQLLMQARKKAHKSSWTALALNMGNVAFNAGIFIKNAAGNGFWPMVSSVATGAATQSAVERVGKRLR